MATAVETSPSIKTNPNTRLLTTSLVGAVFLLASLVIVGYAIPQILRGISLGNPFIAAFVRFVIQIAAIVGFVYVANKFTGQNAPKGLRGGVFIIVATLVLIAFILRGVGFALDGPAGPMITAVVAAALAFGAFKFLTRPQTIGWMHDIEDQGWFSTHVFKRTQGLRLRRYTIMGILLLGLSGVWTILHHQTVGHGDLIIDFPFTTQTLTLLTDKQYAIPLLLAGASLWVAWRAVNVPTFADFLIATEAEMNKVSWSTRKRLWQDTIVVLITTALITGFLLVVDLFWGWAISGIGILPTPAQKNTQQVQKADW